jgi:membrane protease YdiL (CAAX protease family)
MNTSASLKRSPLTFFVLVFALALPFWLLGAFVKHVPIPINLPVSALQFVCPLIAAFILVSREEKRGGIKRLLKSVFDVKSIKPKIWYVPIMLLMPLVMVLSYGVMLLLGRPLPEPYIPFLLIPIFFVVFFIAAAGEEVGWMGYAAPPMQERWSAFTTGLIMGAVWALWHVIPELSANPPAWVAGQFFSTIMLRILIVWLYNNTGKSVLAAILFHDMSNVSEFSFPNYGSHYDPFISDAILVVIVVIVTFLWGPKTLARYRYVRVPQSDGESAGTTIVERK